MSQASTDQLVWMCSSPKYALRSGFFSTRCSAGAAWPVCCACSGALGLLQEVRALMLKRTNTKAAVAATLVFINASIFLNGTTMVARERCTPGTTLSGRPSRRRTALRRSNFENGSSLVTQRGVRNSQNHLRRLGEGHSDTELLIFADQRFTGERRYCDSCEMDTRKT